MSKKDFRSGLDAVLGATEPRGEAEKPSVQAKRGRPKTNFREIEKSSQEGCKEAETRATFIVNEADLEKVKAVAYWERLEIKDVIAAALKGYLAHYEEQAGEIKPKPISKRQ